MASNFKFHVLNVGQGSGNFVEIYANDGDTVPTTTVLIDLGSEGASKSHSGPSVEVVVAALKLMAKPEIACLCLSHSDTDHISMIEQLLTAFDKPGTKNPKKPILTIKTAIYGGNYDLFQKGKRPNVIDLVDGYIPGTTKAHGVTTNCTTYTTPSVVLYEDKVLNFKLPLLIGNTVKSPVTKSNDTSKLPLKDAVMVNTVSLIVVFEWNGVQIITTGDATGITMLRANGVMGKATGSFFTDPVMLTVPHHGSFTTAWAFTGQKIRGNDQRRAQIDLFARRCGAKVLTASAGHQSQFDHPSAYILDIFWRHSSTTDIAYRDAAAITDGHFYTAYFEKADSFQLTSSGTASAWPATGAAGFFTAQSVVQIYTTDYFDRKRLTAVEETPPGGTPKKRLRPEPRMAVFPASVAAPSPGTVVELPDASVFPPAEVSWAVVMDSNKSYYLERVTATTASIALRHSIIDAAEAFYANAGGAPTPSTPHRAVARVRPGADPMPLSRRPGTAPPTAGLPRPKRR